MKKRAYKRQENFEKKKKNKENKQTNLDKPTIHTLE